VWRGEPKWRDRERRAALGRAERASAHGALFVQPLHALDEEARQRAEERAILG
jgi:hypothetical protein